MRRGLTEQLTLVEDERDRLRQHVASLTRIVQIDREAVRQVRKSLVDLQDQRLELREEVAFLTSLLSDGETKAGLRMRQFRLEPLEHPGEYRYRFTLSKFPQNEDEVNARMNLQVSGVLNDADSILDLEKIVVGDLKSNLKFKQVMQVEGALALPEGFAPERISITVQPTSPDVHGINREFAWQAGTR